MSTDPQQPQQEKRAVFEKTGQEYEFLAEKVRRLTDEFEVTEGRRPRLMVAGLGRDDQNRGTRAVAAAFADLGFDVDLGPPSQSPRDTALSATENDVHVVGASLWAPEQKYWLTSLVEELTALGRSDILVAAGGKIDHQDFEFLKRQGVALVFAPRSIIPQAAFEVLMELNRRLG